MVAVLKALVVLLPILIIIAGGLRFTRDDRGEIRIAARPTGLIVGAVLFVIGIFVSLSIGQVEAGTRGVVLRFGAVTGRVLDEGLYFVTPFVNTVAIMDVKIQKHVSSARAASADLQDVSTEVTVNYRLDSAQVDSVYRDVRLAYVATLLTPAVEESIKSVTAEFQAEELITRRADVRDDIEATLKERVSGFGISIEAVSITDFQFSSIFSQSIEAKVVAVQSALEAENKLLEVEIEAKQVEARAKGEADAAIAAAIGEKQAAITRAEGAKQADITRAEGQAQAIVLVADAQAVANDKIRVTLNDELIKYTLTQELGDDVRVVVLPAGSDFILGPEVVGGSP